MVKKTMVYGPHTARTCHKTNQQIKFPTNIRKIQTQDQHGLKMGIDERSIETLIKSAIQERSFHSGWIDGGIRVHSIQPDSIDSVCFPRWFE